MRRRGTILITGFGPFPGFFENVSATLARELAHLAARRFPGRRVVSRVLPTEWDAAPARLKALYDRERPVLALHFGVSERTKGFAIETTARNVRREAQDARGLFPASPSVICDGPKTLTSPLPAHEIAARLGSQGICATVSDNAGTYICNALLYTALMHTAGTRPPVMTGFVHIPAGLKRAGEKGGASDLDWNTALLGGIEIIRACLGRPPSARARTPSGLSLVNRE